jgi:predicted PolB exonuclease-like 3'-5' exonuclease
MLNNLKLEHLLFLDIETVPQYAKWEEVPLKFQDLWERKSGYFRKEDETADQVYERAGIYAEFGKIICVSAGMFSWQGASRVFRMKSYAGRDEKQLLHEFAGMLRKFSAEGERNLVAHNGKDFDFPFLARRMLINGIKLPAILDVAGKKPWEIKFIDTMEQWRFGEYRNYTSLELLTALFDIPTPKDDIGGADVARVYYQENDIGRIAEYCQKDVLAIAQLVLRWRGEAVLAPEEVAIIE